MPAFKDNSGREWLVQLDAPAIRDVREACQVNLGDATGKELARLADDPVLLVDVLWVLCRAQGQPAGVTAEQFGRALVGDAIESATAALTSAWQQFFPASKRSLLLALADKQAAVEAEALRLTMAKLSDPQLLAQVTTAMQAKLEAETTRILTQLRGATDSPESSASGPTA